VNIEKKCDDNVLIIEDFLSNNEISTLDSFMRTFEYSGLKDHEFAYWGKRLLNTAVMKSNPGYERKMDPVDPIIKSMQERIIEVLNEVDHVAKWRPAEHNLIKMYPDSETMGNDPSLEMFIHIDNQAHMEYPIFWGSVTYINDDYEGGEIYYPDYNYWYKPKAGSTVFHSGNTKHGVKKVIKGDRFCAASLVQIEGHYNQNPLPSNKDNPDDPWYYPPGYWGKRMPTDPIQGDIKIPRFDGTTAPYNADPKPPGPMGGYA
jgi:hypothetical protein